jgi:GT2 family glycosyltransferase
MTADQIALCVPCYREADRVPQLVAGLRSLDPQPGAILVLDDGSRDRTAQLLREEGIEVLVHEQNLGLGTGRNTLWRRAEELGMSAVAYLDADVLPPADYLLRVARFLSEPGSVGVGGRNVDSGPLTRSDHWRGRFWPQGLGDRQLMDAPLLIGACASYRIDALRAVGGFNPAFPTHGEDVEIGRRLRLSGQRLRYEPGLTVRHLREDEPRDLLRSCYLHCREGMRATLATPMEPDEPMSLALGMARKLLRAPVAALVKRRDPAEAALGIAACSAGLVGYAVGWGRP